MWGSLQVGRARGSARRQHQIKDGQRRALPGPATLWFETCAPGVRDQLRLRPAYGVLEGRSAKLGRVRQEVVDDDGTREEQCSSRCRGSRCLRPAPGQPAAQVRGGPLRLVPACGANLLGGGGSCALALASESAPCRSIGRSCSRVRRLASALGRHVRRRIGQRHGRGRTLRPSQRERRVHQPSRATRPFEAERELSRPVQARSRFFVALGARIAFNRFQGWAPTPLIQRFRWGHQDMCSIQTCFARASCLVLLTLRTPTP